MSFDLGLSRQTPIYLPAEKGVLLAGGGGGHASAEKMPQGTSGGCACFCPHGPLHEPSYAESFFGNPSDFLTTPELPTAVSKVATHTIATPGLKRLKIRRLNATATPHLQRALWEQASVRVL
jgi:hypothetical protein